MTDPEIVVLWRPGCPYCAALKLRLRVARIPFRQVNIWRDEAARSDVRDHNSGDELVPTVRIGSTYLSNPSVQAIRDALARREAASTEAGSAARMSAQSTSDQ